MHSYQSLYYSRAEAFHVGSVSTCRQLEFILDAVVLFDRSSQYRWSTSIWKIKEKKKEKGKGLFRVEKETKKNDTLVIDFTSRIGSKKYRQKRLIQSGRVQLSSTLVLVPHDFINNWRKMTFFAPKVLFMDKSAARGWFLLN